MAKALPDFVEPALATLVDKVPTGKDWIYEVKFDGYRTLVAAAGPKVRCYTRSGLDWTERFGKLPDAIAELNLDGVLLDGEIVVVDEAGRTRFSALQKALTDRRQDLRYFAFDLLVEGGRSLQRQPLSKRKERLKKLIGSRGRRGPIFFTDHLSKDGQAMLVTLCKKGFEGIIAKRADRPYRSGRGRNWLKIKCGQEQEFIIVGYSLSATDRPFSSLLLGVNEKDGLRYVGRVGSGFDGRTLDDLASRFAKMRRKTSPVDKQVPASIRRRSRWVEPRLVAEVEFNEFTRDGLVRQARYKGLREDKPARTVRRELPNQVE